MFSKDMACPQTRVQGLRRILALLMKLAHKGLDFPFRLACNSSCVDRVDFGAIPKHGFEGIGHS